MSALFKWLLLGCSSKIEIENTSVPEIFTETFIIITLEKLYIFSLSSSTDFFNEITSKINSVELFIVNKKLEENTDKPQILKISKFIQWTINSKKIGIPLDNSDETENSFQIEKWPIIAATGLDSLKLGFFTMSHDIIDISEDLEKLYKEIDLQSCLSLINVKTNMLESILVDFYNYLEVNKVDKRLERSEDELNQNQLLEFIRINYKVQKNKLFSYLNDLPEPRCLYGINSDGDFNKKCSNEALYKTTFDKNAAFHMTYENFEAVTGIRIGRTLILSDLQETYLDLNDDTIQYEFIPTLMYKEVFYLFNLYYILVDFYKETQFDIISGKIKIEKAKKTLCKRLNSFIAQDDDSKNLDYMIIENNILINIQQYELLGLSTNKHGNKIIILRYEIKDLISKISHNKIGSILFCDSFLFCFGELFNLTNDILPFKFIMTSNNYFKKGQYYPNQILTILTKIKIKDLEYKGITFFQDKYNIPFMFPDSKLDGFDHNQMFIFYKGKINAYEDYLSFADSSIGMFIVSYDNINLFSYKEELKYTVIIIEFKDTRSLPLAGIAKNELILYFRGATERYRMYAGDFIDYVQSVKAMRGKCEVMSEEKFFEYEIAIRTIYDNENDNLSYISNSFNLTNVGDVLNEMVEYEFLRDENDNPESFYSFNDYKQVKNDINHDGIIKADEKKNKLMFIFGVDFKSLNEFLDKLMDLAIKCGKKYNLILPEFSLFKFENETDAKEIENKLSNFYISNIKKINNNKNSNTLNFVVCYSTTNVLNLLYNIVNGIKNFYSTYEILNVSYVINYSILKGDKNKDLIFKDYLYDDIVNYMFIDEGLLNQDKISKNNRLVSLANPKCKFFNPRSFYLNEKELAKLFEQSLISEKKLNFYLTYYKDIQCLKSSYQNVYIPFKYMCRNDLLKLFIKKCLNEPLHELFDNCESLNLTEETESIFSKLEKNMLDKSGDFEKALIEMASYCRKCNYEPIITTISGRAKLIEDKEKNNPNVVYDVISNYKEESINVINDSDLNRKEIGLFILGKNLYGKKGIKNLNNIFEYYNKMITLLSGELPKFRNYRNKSDITAEERENLNYANLNQPLPPGWQLVYSVIIDDNDEIHAEHPDIEKFIDEYIELCNAAIDEHNKKIQEELDALMV